MARIHRYSVNCPRGEHVPQARRALSNPQQFAHVSVISMDVDIYIWILWMHIYTYANDKNTCSHLLSCQERWKHGKKHLFLEDQCPKVGSKTRNMIFHGLQKKVHWRFRLLFLHGYRLFCATIRRVETIFEGRGKLMIRITIKVLGS